MRGVIGSDGGVTFGNRGVKFCCEGLFGSGVTFVEGPRWTRILDRGGWKGGIVLLLITFWDIFYSQVLEA